MSAKGSVRRVFPGGNTSRGFYSFYDQILPQEDASRVFVIKGGPGVGKSTFMKKIANEMVDRGYDVEYEQCSSDNDSLDGILIPAIKVALIDGTAPHVVDPKNPGVVDEIINLGEYWDETKITSARDEVLEVNKRTGKLFKTGYSLLSEAKIAYDEWKSHVDDSMDWAKYNEILNRLLDNVFKDTNASYTTKPRTRHMFASAITPGGLKNYIETLLKPDMKVYAIEGQPGTKVKEMIGRVAQTAWEMGYFCEQFHCPFEPELTDMVIVPDINTAVINIYKPFHYDINSVKGLTIEASVNITTCIRTKMYNEYKPDIDDAQKRFYSLITKAIDHISQAKSVHDTMEKYYVSSMNFGKIDEKRQEILQRILTYTRQ